MAYRKKAEFILKHQPDIVIVLNVNILINLKFKDKIPLPKDLIWSGRTCIKDWAYFHILLINLNFMTATYPIFEMYCPLW
jgi:hypothetical protein